MRLFRCRSICAYMKEKPKNKYINKRGYPRAR